MSGPIGSRKTTLANNLQRRYGARIVRTRDLIAKLLPAVKGERRLLQSAGAQLDRDSHGRWLADQLERMPLHSDGLVVVDAVRVLPQIEAIRDRFGRIVTHIHLTAPQEVRAGRYMGRDRRTGEYPGYEEATADRTERRVGELADQCDALIDTSLCVDEDVLVLAAARVGLYQMAVGACVDVIVGGEYGSEGKGNIASYLAPEYEYLVRVGGPNAGHKVISPEFTFHSLPSGTLHAPEAKLLIGPGSTLRLDVLTNEVRGCKVTPGRLFIDPQAAIIEDSDREFEEALKTSIGSTGQGGGYAAARRLMRGKVGGHVRLASEVDNLKPFILPIVDLLEAAYAEGARVLLEGTQGAGLSLFHGIYPYVTSRDTTASGTLAEAGIPPSRVRRIVMVCRSYPIRVGNVGGGTSGPMAQEISWEIIAQRSGIPLEKLLAAEVGSTTARQRRVGEFEWALFRKACSLNGPTDIALSFADYLTVKMKMLADSSSSMKEPSVSLKSWNGSVAHPFH